MKKTFLLLSMSAALFFSACGDSEQNLSENDVPQPVRSAFVAKYPGATDVKWESKTKNDKPAYEVEFKLAGTEKEAYFDATGGFIEEEF